VSLAARSPGFLDFFLAARLQRFLNFLIISMPDNLDSVGHEGVLKQLNFEVLGEGSE
jgi:hypothetical protein